MSESKKAKSSPPLISKHPKQTYSPNNALAIGLETRDAVTAPVIVVSGQVIDEEKMIITSQAKSSEGVVATIMLKAPKWFH